MFAFLKKGTSIFFDTQKDYHIAAFYSIRKAIAISI